jgi:hypothetical protein
MRIAFQIIGGMCDGMWIEVDAALLSQPVITLEHVISDGRVFHADVTPDIDARRLRAELGLPVPVEA